MTVLVSGGSGSGKSEYAEGLSVRLSGGEGLVYVATMEPFGAEALQRVGRHRLLRRGKGFSTVEAYRDVQSVQVGAESTVLLECLSNLLANETFSESPPADPAAKVLEGVESLRARCRNLVVVSSQVYSDGCRYGGATLGYVKALARLDRALAERSDAVVECVCGNPVFYKGGSL